MGSRSIKGSMFNFKCRSLCDLALASSWLGQNIFAVIAGNYRLGMAEHYVDFVAASTAHVHEVGVGSGDEPFELMGLLFLVVGGVEEVSVHLWNLIFILY